MSSPDFKNVCARGAYNDAVFVLSEAGIDNARAEARLLLDHVLNRRFDSVDRLDPSQYREFFSLVGQRASRVPLQHVMGVMYFRHLTLHAKPGVFVVRPETEWVGEAGVKAAREWVRHGVAAQVLDLGCGSGALGLSIAKEIPETILTCVDISSEAVALTKENAQLVGVSARVIQADARSYSSLARALRPETLKKENTQPRFHVIVSNPPYVKDPVTQIEAGKDPAVALYGGGDDGLDIPKKFLNTAAKMLLSGGTLVMEHAETQGKALVQAAVDAGFVSAETGYDLTNRPRYLRAIRGSVKSR